MRRKSLIAITMTVFLSVGLFTGCQKKTVDYGTEDSSMEMGYSDPLQFSGKSPWVRNLNITRENGSSLEVQLDAEITFPEEGQMGVLEYLWKSLDAEMQEQVVKGIFPDSEIYTCEDFAEGYTLGNYHIPVTDYNVDFYRGERDGFTYYLSFYNFDETIESIYNRLIILEPAEKALLSKSVGNNPGISIINQGSLGVDEDIEDVDNQCAISREQARLRAEEFLNDIGLYDYVYRFSAPLLWSAPGEEHTIDVEDGYTFYYEQQWMSEESLDLRRGRYGVAVNDSGIVQMTISDICDLVSMNENVELLPLETIEKLICEELENHPEQYFYESDKLVRGTDLRLCYYEMKDESRENYYSDIPVWELFGQNSQWRNRVRINAIDGSVINPE